MKALGKMALKVQSFVETSRKKARLPSFFVECPPCF